MFPLKGSQGLVIRRSQLYCTLDDPFFLSSETLFWLMPPVSLPHKDTPPKFTLESCPFISCSLTLRHQEKKGAPKTERSYVGQLHPKFRSTLNSSCFGQTGTLAGERKGDCGDGLCGGTGDKLLFCNVTTASTSQSD